jgi:hypothetical protein
MVNYCDTYRSTCKTETVDVVRCLIYDELKSQTYKYGHTYVTQSSLELTCVHVSPKYGKNVVKIALKQLEDDKVIYIVTDDSKPNSTTTRGT